MTVVAGIQASTVTRVAFGDWRRFASFVTQIAIPSQIAIEIRIGISITPHTPATSPAASFSLSWVGVAVASSCARRAVAVKSSGRPEISRFIAVDYRFSRARVNAIIRWNIAPSHLRPGDESRGYRPTLIWRYFAGFPASPRDHRKGGPRAASQSLLACFLHWLLQRTRRRAEVGEKLQEGRRSRVEPRLRSPRRPPTWRASNVQRRRLD